MVTPVAPRMPNLFLIGAPKCGTTSLFHYLNDHPQIWLTPMKEPKYWSPDLPNPLFQNKSLDDYLALFKPAGPEHRIVGEASTTYLSSRCALEQVARFCPEARCIALVRDPLSFLPAYHSEQYQTFHETEADFEKAWRLQDARRRNEQIPAGCVGPLRLDYLWAASFGRQVQELIRLIPKPRRMILVFEDFVENPRRCFDQILEFLEVAPMHRDHFEQFHARRRHRLQALRRLWIRPPAVLRGVINPLRRVLGAEGLNVSGYLDRFLVQRADKQALSPAFREEICRVFADDVRLLEELLGRELNHWLSRDARVVSEAGKP